jgi:hypothetical protein
MALTYDEIISYLGDVIRSDMFKKMYSDSTDNSYLNINSFKKQLRKVKVTNSLIKKLMDEFTFLRQNAHERL